MLSQQSPPVRSLLGAVHHTLPWEQADDLIAAELHLLSTLPKHSLLALLQEPKLQNELLTDTVQFPPPTACATAQEEEDSGMKGQHIQSKAKDLQFDSSVS